MAGVMDVTLERDGHDQPWGFRLQGGKDVGMPLSVQRVLVGTPADGVLKKGDVIIKISQTDAQRLSHQQAADLFTHTGNQIYIQFMRGGGSTQSANARPSVTSTHPVPVSGGVALPGMTTKPTGTDTLLLNLPKTRGGGSSYSSSTQQSSTPMSLTIQNQPYRTTPLVQPTAKKVDVGPGSAVHLKRQAEYITGAREPHYNMDLKSSDLFMKNKVAGTLHQIQQGTSTHTSSNSSPVPMGSPPTCTSKQFYNNPINLYSSDNVAEIAKMNKMGVSGFNAPPPVAHHTAPKPMVNMGILPKKYDPECSATWQALQESEHCQLVTEHGPASSKVYFV